MKIYLMQHGEARSKQDDPQRSLSDKGKQDVDKIAGFVARSGIRPGRIIHSGKLRAEQTAEIMAASISDGSTEVSDVINPDDNVAEFIEVIDNATDDLWVVGHLPFLSKLVSCLMTGDASQVLIDYQPGTVVCLERDEIENWLINWMLRPALIVN